MLINSSEQFAGLKDLLDVRKAIAKIRNKNKKGETEA